MSDRGEAYDAAVEAYEAARAARDHIIDHPDRSVPLDVFKAMIRDAQDAVQVAHKKVMEAWVRA